MIPRGRLIGLFVLAGLPLTASVWIPEGLAVGLAANLVLVALAVADRLLTPSAGQVQISREVSEVLSVGTRNPVVLRVANRSSVRVDVELRGRAQAHRGFLQEPHYARPPETMR